MRFAVDVGGTFSDLMVEDAGTFHAFEAATTPRDPVSGVLAALDLAAQHFGLTRQALLAQGTIFVLATTRALNAILTGTTARTAVHHGGASGHPALP